MAATSVSRRRNAQAAGDAPPAVRGTQQPERRLVGAARGPAEMGAPPTTVPGLPAGGPARFRCPEDFCARPFDPGAAFLPESLGAPGKRLLLIRAPADFRPESLSGHRLALLGCPPLRVSQPDGSQKVYGLQATRGESAARLLIAAAGRPERLTCARPFGGSLRIQERDGEPGALRPLFPVAERPPPQVPAGLKQRFFPSGARLRGPPAASGAPPKAARERGKKRPLLPRKQALWLPEGPERLPGDSPESVGPGSEQRPLEAAEATTTTGPAEVPGPAGRQLWQDARPSGPLGEAEAPGRRARKKEKRRKTGLEAEELLEPSSRFWQPEREPQLQGAGEPEGGRCKGKKKRRRTAEAGAEGLWGEAAIKEEPVDVPCLQSLPEENPRAPGEDPAGEVPGCKKKRRRRSQEEGAEGLWGVFALKEEPGDVPCLGTLLEEGLGSPKEEPGGELAGCIKQSPGKGAGELWGIAALKEELWAVPSVGSLAEESLGVTPEDPAGKLPSRKKKRKKKSQERAAEGLWGVAAIEEPPGNSCLGSLAEESRGSAGGGPAGELLACKKKKKKRGKLDKEPLQEQGTEMHCLEPNVLDWAAPLWQEAGQEEPWQTNGVAPSPRPKKKARRREREDQVGHSAAGT